MTELTTNSLKTSSKEISEVIEDFVSLKPSTHTQRAYRGDIRGFFDSMELVMLDDLALVQFNDLVKKISLYIESSRKTEQVEEGQRITNAKTVNRKQNSLRSFFAYLMSVYNYPKNPLDNFRNLKADNYSNTTSLTKSEIIDLLEIAKRTHRRDEIGFRNYLIIVFLFNMALRREEVVNLKWGDIDLSSQTLNIYQKGGGKKLLPLPSSICYLLVEFKTLYGETIPYIFHPTRNNSHKTISKPLSTSYIFSVVINLAKQVHPEKKITPHSLRKTFIELALDNGEDLISICNATGHSTVEMVKYYDTRDRLKNNAIHSLSGLIH